MGKIEGRKKKGGENGWCRAKKGDNRAIESGQGGLGGRCLRKKPGRRREKRFSRELKKKAFPKKDLQHLKFLERDKFVGKRGGALKKKRQRRTLTWYGEHEPSLSRKRHRCRSGKNALTVERLVKKQQRGEVSVEKEKDPFSF